MTNAEPSNFRRCEAPRTQLLSDASNDCHNSLVNLKNKNLIYFAQGLTFFGFTQQQECNLSGHLL